MLSIFVTVKKMMRSLKRKLKEQGSYGYTCLGLLPDHGYPLGKTLIPAAICRYQGLNSSGSRGCRDQFWGWVGARLLPDVTHGGPKTTSLNWIKHSPIFGRFSTKDYFMRFYFVSNCIFSPVKMAEVRPSVNSWLSTGMTARTSGGLSCPHLIIIHILT